MIRLYNDGLSGASIAKEFNITPRAVYYRLENAGVVIRKSGRRQSTIDRDTLIRLYIRGKLPIYKVAQELTICSKTVVRELEAHSIERLLTWYGHRKPSHLDNLNVGESTVISLRSERIPYVNYYLQAKTRGVKISIRRTGPGQIRITRVK